MLITKFNSMIRNRVVWWIIGGVVIITFVGWFSPRGGCTPVPKAGATGTLDGKPVTETEIRLARFNTYLEICLATGRMLRITPEIDKALREEAWRRLAALRTAEQLGIRASREEVLAAITRNQEFQENGSFSRARYQHFAQSTLRNLGASVNQFEHYIGENVTLRKLQNLTASSAWLAPSSMQRLVARYTDRYSVEYVIVDSNSVPASAANVTEADLKAYYTANTNKFEVPAKVSVQYVTFPIPPHLAEVSVAADAVESYYDTHTDEFTINGTNETKTVTPIEQVRGSISNKLAWEEATQIARAKATDMVIALARGKEDTGAPFGQVAARMQAAVSTSALFAANEQFPGLTNGEDLVSAAFRLRPNADDYFSDAIVAQDSAYVMALVTNTDPYIPSYDIVRKDVVPLARQQALAKAVYARAEALHETFSKGLKQKSSFAAIARQQVMNVSTTGYFSAFTAPEIMGSSEILEELAACNAGELAAVIPLADSYMIAHLIDRQPGQTEDINTAHSQVLASSTRRRGRTLFTEFQEYLLRTGRKTDTMVVPAADREE